MSETIDLAPINVYPGPIEKDVNVQDRRNHVDNLDGADHIDRAVQLRHYENNMQKPENLSVAKERQDNINLVNTAVKDGNYESAKILTESIEFDEKENGFVEEALTTIGHGIQSAANNIFVLGEDLDRLTGVGAFVYNDGEFDYLTRQELDDLGEGYEPYKLDLVDAPQSTTGNVLSGIISFMVPYTAYLKMTKAATAGGNIFRHYSAGAVADFMFDPTHGNLSSVLVEMGVANEVIQALDSRPEEVDQFEKDIKAKFAARGKQTAEGIFIGAVISSIFATVKIASQFPEFVAKAKEHMNTAVNQDNMGTKSFYDNFLESRGTVNPARSDIESLTKVRKDIQSVRSGEDVASTSNLSDVNPTDSRSLDDAGGASATSATVKRPSPDLNEDVPSSQRTDDIESLDNPTTDPSTTDGGISNRSIQDYDTTDEILKIAKENQNNLDDKVKNVASDLDIKIESRVKDSQGLEDKLKRQNKKPNEIGDYLGQRMVFNNPVEFSTQAKNVISKIQQNFNVLEIDYKPELRSIHIQIKHDLGISTELQLRPKYANDILDEQHKAYYSPAKKLMSVYVFTPAQERYITRVYGRTLVKLREIEGSLNINMREVFQ
jgi:hypothetical protein